MVEIEREARLLAMHHPDLDVGDEECSTRREDGGIAANPSLRTRAGTGRGDRRPPDR